MALHVANVLLIAAAAGLFVLWVQHAALWFHLRPGRGAAAGGPARRPGISVLKPLCGLDDRLERNLAVFASLDYRDYEVVLGVRDTSDPAWAVALRTVRKWPHRFRVVVQHGAAGLNPKVNQLIGMARAARHDLLVISDSNVRVDACYLHEIADAFSDPSTGLVTHAVVGEGAQRLGSLFDALHLAGAVAPGMVAAKRLAGQDIVVGKSMALLRSDIAALGGFEAVKDVLAEDFVIGRWVTERLGKRVILARTLVVNVSEQRGLSDFYGRYARWSVMQRKSTGVAIHLSQLLLNPVLLAALAVAAHPSLRSLALAAGVGAVKVLVDAASAMRLGRRDLLLAELLLIPAKDLLFGAAWLHGLLRDDVVWRGNRLRVLPGTRLAPVARRAPRAALGAAAVR